MVLACEEATVSAENVAPFERNTLCLRGLLGKGLELCRQRHPPPSSQVPRCAHRKGCSAARSPKQVHSGLDPAKSNTCFCSGWVYQLSGEQKVIGSSSFTVSKLRCRLLRAKPFLPCTPSLGEGGTGSK